MARILILLACIAVLIAGPSWAKSPPPGTGAADVPANILLMIDTSGSMDEVIYDTRVHYPVDVDFDSAGNIYVAKRYDTVAKYNSAGEFLFEWGGYDGSWDNGKFDFVYSLAVNSSDEVYVADQNHNRIQKFTSSGSFISKFSLLNGPARGVAIDENDLVYALNGNGTVEKFTANGVRLQTWSNSNGRYLAITDSGEVLVSNWSQQRIERYDSNGALQSQFSLGYRPMGVEVDSSGNIYVADYQGGKIRQYDSSGNYLQQWGSQGTGAGQFWRPRGIGRQGSNTMQVADYYNHRVQQPDGTGLLEDGSVLTRLDAVKNVVKNIVSDSDLTSGAQFGLMEWNTNASMEVNVSETGAAEIFNQVDNLNANGWTYLGNAMNVAKTYFLGGSSPMNPEAPCQQNILIVLSDGFWQDDPDPTALDIFTNNDIKTFVVGFQTTGNANYVSLSQNGGSYPDSPLYASNEDNLLEVLSTYIRQIISSQLTFSTPTIIPGVTNEDSILQSTFTYKGDHQWKGRFIKYGLNPDGTIGDTLWDAGEVLNATAADSRNIWTVGNGIPNGLNNFTETNLDRLRAPMEESSGTPFEDEELIALIDFIRGVDSYDEYPLNIDDEGDALLAGERWKLADIYHSRAVVVGPPSEYTSDLSHVNSESYYRYQNGYQSFKNGSGCGGVCSDREEVIYVGSNGGMLHAFDSETGAEKWAFIPPSLLPSLKDAIAMESGKSVSIYGVDGSPVVKDIYYGNQWRTVLMAGMRQGGHSYFALDVTDPNNPQHLFTFAFNPLDNLISYWDAAGVRTDYDASGSVPNNYDYSELGEAWSTPVILKLYINGYDHWVAVMGGGFNNALNPDYAGLLYLIDLEDNGKVLQKITIADGSASNGIVNAVPPRMTTITADSTTLFTDKGALVYFSDLEGKLWKINLTDQGTLYEATQMFNAEATFDNDRMVYHETTATLTEDDILVHYFGTADMQRVGRVSDDIANRALAVYDRNFPNFTSVSPVTVTSMVNGDSGACPDTGQHGWYLDMDPNEKITGRVTIKNSTVFLPRYVPDSDNVCDPGAAKLTEHAFLCGSTIRTTPLGAGMPTEVIVYKNKVYIGISSDASAQGTLPEGFTKQGNLIVGDPANPSPGVVVIESWREAY